MKAEEALKLTLENMKSLKDVLFSIESMAKDGKRYAAFEAEIVPDEILKELKELGYTVSVSSTTAMVTW